MVYQSGVPTGTVPLNQDYLNLQGNFSSLASQFTVDHVPLTSTSGTPPNGYHTAIHLVPQAPPVATAGYGELYCQNLNDGISSGEQVWYQFINGSAVTINYPLTRNFQPLAAATGYTFLPGGFILMWGFATTGAGGTAAITYAPVVLQAAAFSIQLTQFNAGTANIREWGQVFASSALGFTLRAIEDGGGVSAAGRTFYWTAIGA